VRRVLLTGAAGQDGTLLAQRLSESGQVVHGLVRQGRPAGWAGLGLDDVTVHEVDLSDPCQISKVVKLVEPDEIYNLGGQSSVAASWRDPVGTMRSTGVGAVAVFEAARELQRSSGRSVRVVQASSAEIFGRPASAPQTEETEVRPTNPYGVAKAMAHHAARVYRGEGLHISTGILYNHESTLRPETFVTRKVTTAVARIAKGRQRVLSLGNLEARRDWGWAFDYVDAMERIAGHDPPDDFIVATGRTHSVADFVRIAFAVVGIEDWRAYVEVDQSLTRPSDDAVQVGETRKIRAALGWEPQVGFEEIVRRMVEHDLALVPD
jgi:GDPmannose 4,6-dehydratase